MPLQSFVARAGLAGLLASAVPIALGADQRVAAGLDSHDRVVRDMRSARSLYILKCSGCHGTDGTGAPTAGIPPFPGFIGALARHTAGRVYIAHVPGIVGSRLSNEQLVKVLNYVIDEWSGEDDTSSTPRFTVAEFIQLRAVPVTNIVAYRRDVVAQMKEFGEPVADYPWP